MNYFTTDILQTLVAKGDLKRIISFQLEKAFNTLPWAELTAFLENDKLTLEMPRDHDGKFK